MISCDLQGGLSNQLFQIAATYALSLRNEDDYGLDFDKCYTPNQGYSSNKYKNNILSKVNKINHEEVNFKHFYNEQNFSYEELPPLKDILLNGYFQSEKYFLEYKKEIMDLFYLSSDDKKKIREKFIWWGVTDKSITSIHVRRGDYLKHPKFHPVLTIDYFNEAIKNIGDSYFIVVSDDMEWVKTNIKGDNILYSDFNDEILDLTLMTMCDNNIISNSSFSWWGAWLNNNLNKIIISPKKSKWFGELGPKDTKDIIPETWIQI